MAKVAFTAARVMKFKCPTDKEQAFLWDSTAPGLGLRCTPLGSPSYVFQGRYQDKTIRLTIGSPTAWSIPEAQDKARELQRLIDVGRDPRVVKAEQKAKDKAHSDAEKLNAVTLGEVWAEYIQERRPFWGDAHYKSHLEKADAGGRPSKRRGMTDKLTKPGPLASLMPLALKDLESTIIESWAAKEGKDRPSSARLAWRLLTVFLNWCSEQPMYANAIPLRNPAKTKKTREALGKQGVKDDVLTREQLSAWFSAVQHIPNRVISAYLQVMLLTGARPTEVLDLQWKDINYQWKGLTIRDKVEGERVIPLTPYVAQLLSNLPQRNQWVFSSTRPLAQDEANKRRRAYKAAKRGTDVPIGDILITSDSGRITKPNTAHSRACSVAGIEELTLHGLRRSFASLTEWLEIPTGVVAQIQGHKPSATAEKHYKRRPLDLLRLHHERIEAWMLEQGKVLFTPDSETRKLSVVM
jgi:integrase